MSVDVVCLIEKMCCGVFCYDFGGGGINVVCIVYVFGGCLIVLFLVGGLIGSLLMVLFGDVGVLFCVILIVVLMWESFMVNEFRIVKQYCFVFLGLLLIVVEQE